MFILHLLCIIIYNNNYAVHLCLAMIISVSRKTLCDTVHLINKTLTLAVFCFTVPLFSVPYAGLDLLVCPVQEPHGQHQ